MERRLAAIPAADVVGYWSRRRRSRRLHVQAGLYGDAIELATGALPVPQSPGLGLDPDPNVMREYRVADD